MSSYKDWREKELEKRYPVIPQKPAKLELAGEEVWYAPSAIAPDPRAVLFVAHGMCHGASVRRAERPSTHRGATAVTFRRDESRRRRGWDAEIP